MDNEKLSESILASIYEAYLSNKLDECRPEWNNGLKKDLKTELYCGRGGKRLITLQDCKDAYERCKSDIKQSLPSEPTKDMKEIISMNLRLIYTGTKVGYENYHGEIISEHGVITTWDYDKRQGKYICNLKHENYKRGCKFFYHNSPEGLLRIMQKELQKLNVDLTMQ